MENSEPKRLQVFLASCGVGSRRACEQLIEQGRVAINGRRVTTQGIKVDGSVDVVTLDGNRVRETTQKIYIVLNKPEGYICTNDDPQGRPLAVDLLGAIAKKNRIFSVGRLDLMSSGLILYTNDGKFARAVAHPSAGVEKEYLVETRKPVTREVLEEFTAGIRHLGVHYAIVRYRSLSPTRVAIVLQEGKNRELRNMFAARRISIKRIHRTRIGGIRIGSLGLGEFRFLSRAEVANLIRMPTESGAAARRSPPRGPRSVRTERPTRRG